MFDVIVIGAGPAGSTASKILADKGYKVLLVEKFKMPRYKSCSGQLIKKSVDLVQKYFGETVPVSTMCAPTENRGMILTDGKGRTYRFEQPGLNVWRSEFDKWLADQAAQAGAEVRDNTSSVSIEEQNGIVRVTLKGERTYCIDILIYKLKYGTLLISHMRGVQSWQDLRKIKFSCLTRK